MVYRRRRFRRVRRMRRRPAFRRRRTMRRKRSTYDSVVRQKCYYSTDVLVNANAYSFVISWRATQNDPNGAFTVNQSAEFA